MLYSCLCKQWGRHCCTLQPSSWKRVFCYNWRLTRRWTQLIGDSLRKGNLRELFLDKEISYHIFFSKLGFQFVMVMTGILSCSTACYCVFWENIFALFPKMALFHNSNVLWFVWYIESRFPSPSVKCIFLHNKILNTPNLYTKELNDSEPIELF